MLNPFERSRFFEVFADFWPGSLSKKSGQHTMDLWDEVLGSYRLDQAIDALKQLKRSEEFNRPPTMGQFKAAARELARARGWTQGTSKPYGPTETWHEFVASGGVEEVIARLEEGRTDVTWLKKNLPRWKAGAKLARPVADDWRSPFQAKDRPRDYMPPPIENDDTVPF